jgi:Hsp20/alpha crystallin family protein
MHEPRQRESEAGNYLQQEHTLEPMSRVFEFPVEIDTDNIRATLDRGLLKVRVPKASVGRRRAIRIARRADRLGFAGRLREEGGEDLLYLPTLTLGALRPAMAMVRQCLHPLEDVLAFPAAILVGGHTGSSEGPKAMGPSHTRVPAD